MTRTPHQRLLIRGWSIVAVLTLANFTVYAGTSEGSLSVFWRALVNEFGWSRGMMSTVGTLHLMIPGLAAYGIGAACDRFGSRRIATLGILAGALGFMTASMAGRLGHFYVFATLVALAESGIGFIPMQLLVSRWFPSGRGFAMAVATAGISVGGVTGPLLAMSLIERYSWRVAFAFYGIGCLVVAAPALFLLVRNRPADVGLDVPEARPSAEEADGGEDAASNNHGVRVGVAVRTLSFWAITLTTAAGFYAVYSIAEHWVLYVTGQGLELRVAARLLSLYYFMGVLGRFLWGPLFDRFAGKPVALTIVSGMTLNVAMLTFWTGAPAVPYVYAVMFGLCYGGFIFMMPLLLAEQFGVRHLGKIIGASAAVAAFLSSLSPAITGFLFDATGTYRAPFAVATIVVASGAVMLSAMRTEPVVARIR